MSFRLARLGGLLAAALALLGTTVPAASADTYKTITFVGSLTFSSCMGLGYPIGVVPALPTVKPGPKPGTTVVNIPPQGNHCNFSLTSAACTKTSVGKKVAPSDVCTFLATGTVWGYCGYYTSMGTVRITTASKGTITTPYKITGVGDALTVTGGGTETNIIGEAIALPTTGSCQDKAARAFTVMGGIAYKDCNDGTVAGVCDAP